MIELTSILELLRFPVETVGIILIWQIHQRQRIVAVRVQHIEKKLGIIHLEGLLS